MEFVVLMLAVGVSVYLCVSPNATAAVPEDDYRFENTICVIGAWIFWISLFRVLSWLNA